MHDDILEVKTGWLKLRTGAWGARVWAEDDLEGKQVILTRRDGGEARRTLGPRVARYRDETHPAIYALVDSRVFHSSTTEPKPPTTRDAALGRELPKELRQKIADALDGENEDDVYSALMQVATIFGIR